MAQIKCFNIHAITDAIEVGMVKHILTKGEKPDISEYILNTIDTFVAEDYPTNERVQLSEGQRKDLINLIVKAAESKGIIYNPETIERRVFPDVLVEEVVDPESSKPKSISLVSVFSQSHTYVTDEQRMYGSQAYPRQIMLNDFKKLAVDSFFIKNGVAVRQGDIAMNILESKIKLVENVLDVLTNNSIRYKIGNGYATIPGIRKTIKGMRAIMAGNGKYANMSMKEKAIELNNHRISIYALQDFLTRAGITSIPTDTLSRWANGNTSDKAKLRAYNSMFMLRNFDKLVQMNFNNILEMKNSEVLSGSIEYTDYKLKLNKNNMTKNWSDEDSDISAFKEAGNVVKSLLEVIPFYDYNSKKRTENTLGWNRFNSAIGFLKNIPNTPAGSMTMYRPDRLDRNSMQRVGTIGEYISRINDNPSKNLKEALDVLFTTNDAYGSDFFDAVMNTLYPNQGYQRDAIKNALYSIYQSFYVDESGLRLYNTHVQNQKNHNSPDYYSYITQYVAGSYRMQFVYYKRDSSSASDNVMAYMLNDRALSLTEERIKSHIYNSSMGIVSEFKTWANSNITDEVANRFRASDVRETSIEYLLRKKVSGTGYISEVRISGLPIANDVYDITFDTTNPFIVTDESDVSAFEVMKRDEHGNEHKSSINDIARVAVDNGNPMDMTTPIDDLLSIAFAIPINSNETLRRLLYQNGNTFNEASISNLLKGAFSIIALSEANNSHFSTIESSDQLNNEILNEGIFPVKASGTDRGKVKGSVMRMMKRPGINNISTGIGNVMETIIGAMSYIDNAIGRDTVRTPDGKSVAITQQNRLVLSQDSQKQRIYNSASPAKSLPTVVTADEFRNVLIAGNGIQQDDVTLMQSIGENEQLSRGSVTVRMTNLNGEVKNRSQFNIEESVITDFVLNYLDGIYGDGDISFNTQVNSDKSNITNIVFNGKFIRNLYKLNDNELSSVISATFGELYFNIVSNISTDFKVLTNTLNSFITNPEMRSRYEDCLTQRESNDLTKFINEVNRYKVDTGNDVDINISNNFDAFNTLATQAGVNAYDMVMTISKINNYVFDSKVTIIDQTHVQRGKDGTAQFNKLLVSKYARFYPTQTTFDLSSFSNNPAFFSSWETFYRTKNEELFYSLVSNNINISTDNASGRDNGFSGLNKLRMDKPALFKDSRMILGKLKKPGSPDVVIASKNDMRAFLEEQMKKEKTGNIFQANRTMASFSEMKEYLSNIGYSIVINPELAKFNWIDYFVSQSYEISSVGDNFNHPVKGEYDNDMQLDALATYAQIKRNVSHTTTVRPWIVNHLDGVPKEVNIATIEDMGNTVSSFSAMTKNISPHDGIVFMSPLAVHLFNNSLMDSRVGTDMKPFFHDFNLNTATGVIVKCSTNAFTNKTIKYGKNFKSMTKKMLDYKWKTSDGTPINGDIFTDFNFRLKGNSGSSMNLFNYISKKYHPMVKLDNGSIYEITDIKFDRTENGVDYYNRTLTRVDKNGDYDESSHQINDVVSINSNYDLWVALGAENSIEKSADTGRLMDSENSLLAIVDIMNTNGVVSTPGADIQSQEDVYQFMKHGNADMVVTNGAIKQGYANVNKADDFYNAKKGTLNMMNFDLTHSGVVLDPTHESDDGVISELTQVINALSSQGFSKDKSSAIYDALAVVTRAPIEDMVQATGGTMDFPNYQDLVSTFIVKAMAENNAFSDDERNACIQLINRVKLGNTITFEQLSSKVNLVSNSFIIGAVPVIASYINSISIQKKNAGSLALMKASSGMVQLHGGKMWGDIGTTDAEKANYLLNLETNSTPFINPSKALMGHIYKMSTNANTVNEFISEEPEFREHIEFDGEYAYFNLKDYASYKSLVHFHSFNETKTIAETFIRKANPNEEADLTITGNGGTESYIALGRELAPINYHFKIGGETRNMYDLYSIHLFSRVREKNLDIDSMASISQALDKALAIHGVYNLQVSMFDKARVLYQKELEQLSSVYNGGEGFVVSTDENGRIVPLTIDKGSVDVKYYEAIGPNINQSTLGIPSDMSLNDVSKEYFAKKFVADFGLKIDDSHYTYSLIKNSGRHIYIYDANEDFGGSFDSEGYTQVEPKVRNDNNGHIYRVNEKGEDMYELSPSDAIYRHKNGAEVIVTKNPGKVIESIGFYGFKVSPNVYKNANVDRNPENIAQVKNIITMMLSSVEAKFNKKGQKLSGNETVRYLLRQDENGISRIDEALNIAYDQYTAIKNGKIVDSSSLEIQDAFIRAIDNGRLDEFRLGSSFQRYVYRNATSRYNSFRESLKSLVARTPSQTMQSFMPMEIVEFDRTGKNVCYVSDMQVWLQGSDFDGDKTNFQEYDLGRTGVLIGWSPLFDAEQLSESMRLPFPNGVEAEGFTTIKDELTNVYNELFSKVYAPNEDGDYVRRPLYKMSDMISLINFINDDFKKMGGKNIRKPYSAQATRLKNFIKDINTHNTYMNNLTSKKLSGIKNYITRQSIDIITDPVNLYEAQSSVDDMGAIKKLGDSDAASKERLLMSHGNFILRYDAMKNNIMGKNVISVVASGMKTFFNIVNYYNTIGGYDENRFSIGKEGKGITVLGKKYNFIANWNPSGDGREMLRKRIEAFNERVKNGEVVDAIEANLVSQAHNILDGTTVDENAALILSALLSEATDNAKNLNLAKINADENMTPFYTYGITIGMKIEDIAKIMMSPTARMIADIKNGNIFYGTKFNGSINKFIKEFINKDKVIKGVKLNNDLGLLSKDERLKNLLESVPEFKQMYESGFASERDYKGDYLPVSYIYYNLDKVKDEVLRKIRMMNLVNTDDEAKLINQLSSYINHVKDVLYIRSTVQTNVITTEDGKKYRVIDELNNLEKGVNEMRLIARIVGLNKGVKTTRDKQIAFSTAMRSIFDNPPKDGKNLVSKFLESNTDNPYMDKSGFSFERFIRDPQYRTTAIDLYERFFKHSFNVLDIAYELPLIREYITVSNIATGISNNISVKNKVIDWLSERVISDLGSVNQKERLSVIKNVNMYVNSTLFDQFIKDVNMEFTVPNGRFYTKGSTGLYLTGSEQQSGKLGTVEGNANFLKWMNEIVIPNMKIGIFDETGKTAKRVVRNEFISSLGMVGVDRTLSGAPINVYAPNVDKRSNNTNDEMMLSVIKNAAETLDSTIYMDSGGRKHNVSDLLYVYNQLNFNGVSNVYSMDEILSVNGNLSRRHAEFEQTQLTEENATNLIRYDYALSNVGVLKYLAPEASTNSSNAAYIRAYNNQTMRTEFYNLYTATDRAVDKELDSQYEQDDDPAYEEPEGYSESEGRSYEGFNKSRYLRIDYSQRKMYDNYIHNEVGLANSNTVKGSAENFNFITKRDIYRSQKFDNVVEQEVNEDYAGAIYDITKGELDADKIYSMIQDIGSSITGVVHVGVEGESSAYIMQSERSQFIAVDMMNKAAAYIDGEGTVQLVSGSDYNSLGFAGYVGSTNFNAIRNIIDNIENNKMCSL